VREWFGERLKQTNEAAWKEAHSRLYDHLRDTTHEGQKPTLADLAPLYHAIAHGCRAGRHEEALYRIYVDRICRRYPNGQIEFYSLYFLGAFASNLAAISWFFDRPFQTPAAALTPPARAWVLSQASSALRTRGRLQEALPAMRAVLRIYEDAPSWTNAANAASNLSQMEMLVGDIATAVVTAEKSVAYADRSGNAFWMLANRALYSAALHAAGQREKAERFFDEAEQRLQDFDPQHPSLHSMPGYEYCDLLLSLGRVTAVRNRAAQSVEIARQTQGLLDIALATLMLDRICITLALRSLASGTFAATVEARSAGANLDEAMEGLRASGQSDFVPRGLIARAAFRRAVGDWDGAARDLDEAEEIAEPGPMRLFLCDCALERARLALARREAFAPLAGLIDPSPRPPALPDAATAAALGEEARNELDAARKLIAACGYRRRDEDLAELDDVVAGRRRFADLPPRV
jgi:tetratricopeptide (TPR) repeat protein